MPRDKKQLGWLATVALALGVGLLLAILAATVWHQRLSWRLNAKLTAIRAAGDPVELADMAPATVTDGDNAALVLRQADAEITAFAADHYAFVQTDAGGRFEGDNLVDRGQPTEAQIDLLARLLKSHAGAIEAADRAAACDRYDSLIDFVKADASSLVEAILPVVQRSRTVGRLNGLRCRLHTARGEHTEGAEVGLRSLRLARFVRSEPTMVALLVGIALDFMAVDDLNRVLRSGPIDDDLRRRIDTELVLHDDPVERVRILKQERAFSLASLDSVPSFGQATAWRHGLLEWYDHQLGIADQPWHQVAGELNAGPPLTDLFGGAAALTSNLLPAVQAMHDAHNRMIARTRCLRVLDALQAFAADNGREAAGLSELDLPAAATVDPYSGKPLVVELRDDGWWVYSLGSNGVDDGGEMDDLSDIGLSP